ncbi:unnamed protein product [Fraxinus pennsylvanica]|uniref:Receptor-like serine/threonine-protein kinase n=1 Tax=Fraxinus pennsylvanica TaxID=56036 RepID=A0AAD2A2R9_9LAMI|nr:unnamed protein product [Fraxinus pennsylvanica]
MERLFSMAAFLTFLILSALMAVSAQQQRYSNISLGSSLKPSTNSSWLSPSGLYAFGFYKLTNGYAVGVFIAGIPEKTVVWTANRDDPVFPRNANLLLTNDGRLTLQQEDRDDINIASSVRPVVSASMLDNGNFVLYDSSRRITWQSFDSPTDTLLPDQRLPPGMDLVSSASKTNPARGIFRLAMQGDGHLVQYPVEISGPNYAYYASGTMGTGNNVSLNLDNNGHLYLFNGSSIIKNLTTGQYRKRTIYLVRIDVDGIFRLYYRSLDPQGNWTKEWSPSEDICGPLGLCGLNGYCIQLDTVAECECLPGFDRVSPGNWTSGCERNFVMEGCKAKDQNVSYEIISLDNIVWEDVNYGVLVRMAKEDCAKACLEDCNCDAAFFQDGTCTKQRLPLRYGRRVLNNPTVSLIKVNTTAPSTPRVPNDDGRLILQQEDRGNIIIASSVRPVVSASMLDNGNFVLYDSSRRITWQSFDSPTDTLLPGQRLPNGVALVSSASKTNPARGIFRLVMQNDGNLVQYPVGNAGPSYAYYASATDGTGNNVSLNLDNNGLLYLFNGSSIIRNLTTGQYRRRTIYLVRIDVDGIFRLYYRSLDPQGNWTKEWSPTEDKCAPLGLCGLNGYCIHLDTVAECECLPGFDRVSPGNWTSGCERNFVMEGCKAKDQNVSYEIISLDNVVWEDDNYGVLVSMTKEDCENACLEDCNSALILAIFGIYVHRNHVGRYKTIPHVGLIEDVGLRAFTYPELVEATNEFKEELGRGASGTVYKGTLSDSRRIRGTRGYVAPEWHRKLPVTVKADVYSFGIVLLEIICGRKSVDSSLSPDEAILEEWVYNCFAAGELNELVGDEEVDERKLDRMIKIGIWCIQDEPSLRPSMKKVLLMLEGTVEIPVPPSPTSFLSTI